MQEHERAVLMVDFPDFDLKAGDVGRVVHLYTDGAAYEVEFLTLSGRTLDVVTVEASQVRAVTQRDVLHVREHTGE
jgi:hypothetical protein